MDPIRCSGATRVSTRSSMATAVAGKENRDGTRPPYGLGALALRHPRAPGERSPGAWRPAGSLHRSCLPGPRGPGWMLGADLPADGRGLVLRLETRWA